PARLFAPVLTVPPYHCTDKLAPNSRREHIRGNVKNGHPDVERGSCRQRNEPISRKEPAMHILGLDAHSATFTVEILNPRGRVCREMKRETSAENLIEAVREAPGPKVVVVEESHLAQWVKRTVERYVDKVVICDPKRNKWISGDEFNDDASSAHKLAELYRGGYIKEIRHPDDGGAKLRSLFLHYYDLNQQLTRFKNKLKAVFRQEAIGTTGKGIYDEERHAAWLQKLRGQQHLQHAARQRFELIDVLESCKHETYEVMVQLAKKNAAYRLLDSMPGAGPVIATGYLALIDTPDRFSRKNKLWSYAGFGNKRHTSDDEVYEEHASKNGNRPLKWVVIEHFLHAVQQTQQGNRFKRCYEELRRKGLDETAARRAVCRKLLSTVRALWMKGAAYRDDPLS
ncbi:MAG: transposase, partial [Planctomycetota bacterium]